MTLRARWRRRAYLRGLRYALIDWTTESDAAVARHERLADRPGRIMTEADDADLRRRAEEARVRIHRRLGRLSPPAEAQSAHAALLDALADPEMLRAGAANERANAALHELWTALDLLPAD